MNTFELEKIFQCFVSVAEEWRDTVTKHAFFHDLSYEEQLPVRHIATISDDVLKRKLQKLQNKWQEFADLMTDPGIARQLHIPEASYLPVPFIIETPTQDTCVKRRSAVKSNLITKTKMLKRYDACLKRITQIKRQKRILGMEKLKATLEKERAVFENDADTETYRVRKPDYNDVLIHLSNTDNNFRRVGWHGAVIFTDAPEKEIPVLLFDEKKNFSCYEEVKSVQCTAMPNSYVYRARDIDTQTQMITNRNYIKARIDARLTKFEEAKEKLLNNPTLNSENKIHYMQRINHAWENLTLLNKMDEELLESIAESNGHMKKITLRAARALYGKEIESRYGVSFSILNENAKLKKFRKNDKAGLPSPLK